MQVLRSLSGRMSHSALTAELAPQTEKDLVLAQKSKDFYELVK